MTEVGSTKNAWLIAVASICCAFLANLDINITIAVTELIRSEINTTVEENSAITSVYMIGEILIIPLIPLIIKRFSLQKIVFVSLFSFGVFSFLCAYSWDYQSIVCFRFFQGVSGGVFIPLSYIIIKDHLPEKDQPKALGWLGVTASLAPVLGPCMAAIVPEGQGFGVVFLVNVPLCVLLFSMYKEGFRGASTKTEGDKVVFIEDLLSIFLIGVSLLSMMYVLENGVLKGWWDSDAVRYSSYTSIVTFILFCHFQKISRNRIIDFDLLKDIKFSFVCICSFISGVMIFGLMYVIPYYLISIHNYNPTEIALVVLMSSAPQIVIVQIISRVNYTNFYLPVIGFGSFILSLSCWMNSHLSSDFYGTSFLSSQLLRAVGLPLFLIPLSVWALRSVDKGRSASASVLFNLSRTIGGAIGVAALVSFTESNKSRFYQYGTDNVTDAGFPELQGVVSHYEQSFHILAFNESFSLLSILTGSLGGIFIGLFLLNLIMDKRREKCSHI